MVVVHRACRAREFRESTALLRRVLSRACRAPWGAGVRGAAHPPSRAASREGGARSDHPTRPPRTAAAATMVWLARRTQPQVVRARASVRLARGAPRAAPRAAAACFAPRACSAVVGPRSLPRVARGPGGTAARVRATCLGRPARPAAPAAAASARRSCAPWRAGGARPRPPPRRRRRAARGSTAPRVARPATCRVPVRARARAPLARAARLRASRRSRPAHPARRPSSARGAARPRRRARARAAGP